MPQEFAPVLNIAKQQCLLVCTHHHKSTLIVELATELTTSSETT